MMALVVTAPIATSRAQDVGPRRASAQELETLRALKVVAIDGGEAISITSGAASITLKKDGTVVIKGTEIVIDDGRQPARSAAPSNVRASEIF
ncbi:MAG: hypothetical protein KIT84_37265 [Labilithrix sp.]|nr:hypothetical protein [Labilithrix sp.]